ncbi:hypothetical protein HBI56_133290 [Parastagonospora nodorum]|nr:hypothetical protein HBH56_036400 [Parastagonospora nodorum]KAH3934009.1 hypothetical protein HBH54_063070 [Parastagonospora nodorum]KAH3952447.1 hypothetical protein HBH53_047040 [Parastagonospora nodorum]KAH3979489.1 hypothetical protein HBH51_058050 [Parastagonospora nodorum]KAH3980299.1 hypothetical protein HBH52_094200 [Parastagonospora nodorum]
MLDLLNEQAWISPSSDPGQQGIRLWFCQGFEHVEERFEIFMLALLHGGFGFGVLAWTFSSYALMAHWTASVALSSWSDETAWKFCMILVMGYLCFATATGRTGQ